MTLTANIIEQSEGWCARSETLTDIRVKARSDYFGYDEPGEVKYMPGAEEVNSRERRLIGRVPILRNKPTVTLLRLIN